MNKYLSLIFVSIAPIMLLSVGVFIMEYIKTYPVDGDNRIVKLIIVEFAGLWMIGAIMWGDYKLNRELDTWKQ